VPEQLVAARHTSDRQPRCCLRPPCATSQLLCSSMLPSPAGCCPCALDCDLHPSSHLAPSGSDSRLSNARAPVSAALRHRLVLCLNSCSHRPLLDGFCHSFAASPGAQ